MTMTDQWTDENGRTLTAINAIHNELSASISQPKNEAQQSDSANHSKPLSSSYPLDIFAPFESAHMIFGRHDQQAFTLSGYLLLNNDC
jgi:hypothetical protein